MSASQTEQHRDPDWLERRYHGDGMTAEEMAAEAGVSQRTILDWMEKHGVERRSRGRPKADERALREDLRRVARLADGRPKMETYQKHGEFSYYTVRRRLGGGSWAAAVDEVFGGRDQ